MTQVWCGVPDRFFFSRFNFIERQSSATSHFATLRTPPSRSPRFVLLPSRICPVLLSFLSPHAEFFPFYLARADRAIFVNNCAPGYIIVRIVGRICLRVFANRRSLEYHSNLTQISRKTPTRYNIANFGSVREYYDAPVHVVRKDDSTKLARLAS